MNELGNTPADKDYKPSGISRAEEAARKAYPYDGGTKGWICKSSRPIFIKGYEQAEKDLALTWEDMQLIWQILDMMDEECKRSNPEWAYGSESYFTEVLKRFKEEKK